MLYNSEGSYRTTTEAMMKAFDKLPTDIRRTLNESLDDWIPQVLLTIYRKGCRTMPKNKAEQLCIELIQEWNWEEFQEHWQRMYRMQNRGIDYNVPIRRRKK